MKVNRQDSLNNEYLVSKLIEGSKIPILRQISIVSDEWSPCHSKTHSECKEPVTWEEPEILKHAHKSSHPINPYDSTTEGEISRQLSRRQEVESSKSAHSGRHGHNLQVQTLGFRPSSFTKSVYEDSPELKNPIPLSLSSELEAKSRELFEINVCPAEGAKQNRIKNEEEENDSDAVSSDAESRSLFYDQSFQQSSAHDYFELSEEEEIRLIDGLLYKITTQEPEQIIDDIINLVENKPSVMYPQRQNQKQKGKRTAKQVQFMVKQFYKNPEWSRNKAEEIGKAIGLSASSVLKWRHDFLKKEREAHEMLLCFEAAAQGLL